jgi:thiamine biosynthesis protein ThiS
MSKEVLKLVANGRETSVDAPCTVGEFLRRCGWLPTQVIVEHNGTVLSRMEIDRVELVNNDRLEVVVPVAGG